MQVIRKEIEDLRHSFDSLALSNQVCTKKIAQQSGLIDQINAGIGAMKQQAQIGLLSATARTSLLDRGVGQGFESQRLTSVEMIRTLLLQVEKLTEQLAARSQLEVSQTTITIPKTSPSPVHEVQDANTPLYESHQRLCHLAFQPENAFVVSEARSIIDDIEAILDTIATNANPRLILRELGKKRKREDVTTFCINKTTIALSC